MHQINPANNVPPEDLWDRLKQGDEQAFEQIYGLYVEDLFRFGKSFTHRETLVKDCIQDVFIDLWHYRAKLTSDVRIKFYLMRSLSNKIKRSLGQETRVRKYEFSSFFGSDTFQASIEDELISGHDADISRQKLDGAMSDLPARQKEVIFYVFYEKMSYEEVAKLMDIHIRSAYTLAWKAIKALKKKLLFVAQAILFMC